MAGTASEEIAIIGVEYVTPALNHETRHTTMDECSIVVIAIHIIEEIRDRLRLRIAVLVVFLLR